MKKSKRLITHRALINLDGSLAVVLPKPYVNQFGLKPKDEVVVVVDGFIVKIAPFQSRLVEKGMKLVKGGK
jgi:antitoxin component of MazEF toxin-antitoxin module